MAPVYYTLKRGHQGTDVVRMQQFLIDQGVELGFGADGDFGRGTEDAVKRFQAEHGLEEDGIFGRDCRTVAIPRGYQNVHFEEGAHSGSSSFPPRPNDLSSPNAAAAQDMFGSFRFRSAGNPSNPEQIVILDDWVADNILRVDIPQLVGMVDLTADFPRFMATGAIRVHKRAAPKFLELFAAWQEAGLMDRMLYYVGAFNARLKRGRTRFIPGNLSNHSWGSAMDINTRMNGLGAVPAKYPSRGCVRELVGIANDVGFYWGGHYSGRKDGMHFELARL